MKFHKEGYPTLIITIFVIILLNYLVSLLDYHIVNLLTYIISIILLVTVLQFFRNPKRKFNIDNELVLSPADGKVVVIEEVEETEYFNDKRLQVSIFMSPTNVHLNRYPIAGIIRYFKYHPGSYLVAWHPKSSTENERTTIVIEDKIGRNVLYRQIAGAMARRIVFYGKEGEEVEQTNECGFIKFGSRVDLLLPMDVKLNVKLNDNVKGGISEIAKF